MRKINLDRLDKVFPNAYFQAANGCAETGYDDKPVIMADWNHVRPGVFEKIEALGFACEWGDEWATCTGCGKAVRTSPNSYDWQRSYVIYEGELLCLDCVNPSEYVESLHNNTDAALTNEFTHKYPLEDYGYEQVNEESFTNGMHPGHNDSPTGILNALLRDNPDGLYVFALDYTNQFEAGFSVYRKV